MPDGNVIKITGRNGEGKSSVLDAIEAVLSNPRGSNTPRPIHGKEDKAVIVAEVGNFIVRRVFTDAGTRLTVTGAEGAEYKSPQKVMDGFLGTLSFDPLEFIDMKDKEQVDTLLQFSGSDFDFAASDEARKSHYDSRADENKAVKTIYATIGEEPEKIKKVDLSAIQYKMTNVSNLARDIKEQTEKKERLQKSIEEIDAYLVEAKKTFGEYDTYNNLEQQLKDGIANNERAGDWQKWSDSQEGVKVREDKAAEHDRMIGVIDEQKKTALAELNLPYPGLSFEEGMVMYNEVPLRQASKAEQIRVSMAVAMAMKPEIRIVLIRDGSLLDSTNLALIHKLAEKNDYQVWIEAVDETGDVGIYLEDGMVK